MAVFVAVSVLVAIIDACVLIMAVLERDRDGYLLATCLAFALLVDLFYLQSVSVGKYFDMSAYSSAYFACVDLVLISLLTFLFSLCELWKSKVRVVVLAVFLVLVVIDVAFLAANPFTELILTYTYDATSIAHWHYAPYLGYTCHLILCYIMVVACFAVLLYRCAAVPKAYRLRYLIVLIGMLFTVLVNAVFLFIPSSLSLDYSLVFYSVLGIYVYVVVFRDRGSITLAATQDMVFSQLGSAVVLFDNERHYAVCNQGAKAFVPAVKRNRRYELSEFLKDQGLDGTITDLGRDWSFGKKLTAGGAAKPYRVELKTLHDTSGRDLGSLVVFTDVSSQIDQSTGFHTKAAFEREYSAASDAQRAVPTTVCICDLNHLGNLNKRYGREAGDEAMKVLADAMVEFLPKGSFFARHDDANLLAVCEGASIANIQDALRLVAERVRSSVVEDVPLDMQSAASATTEENRSIFDATNTAISALKLRKMLDFDSAHSSLLASLAMTQRQSDGETEKHVRRTRVIADALATRLGLSDWDKSSLALLCLLHDIGKVGVPLEILNKPTKLSDSEWEVLKSHVVKGYEIASASDELRGIADGILHHHERWDGLGYPDGLAGEAIPLISRILSVVDTYDAMTHDRPYRRALSREVALEELKRCAGSQFDPTVVAEFLAVIDEGVEFDAGLAADAAYSPSASAVDAEGVLVGEIKVPDPAKRDRRLFAGGRTDDPERHLGCIRYARYTLDENQHIVSCFGAFEDMTGYSIEDVAEYDLSQDDLLFPGDSEEYWSIVREQLELHGEAYLDHLLRRKDGASLSVFCYGSMFFDSAERRAKSQIIIADVASAGSVKSVMNRARVSALSNVKKWEDRANRDDMTGLLNRSAYSAEVQMRLLEGDRITVLLMLDIDKFKGFNDTYGHLEGDKLLVRAAHAFEEAVGEGGLVSRMGGDEFSAALFFSPDVGDDVMRQRVEDIFKEVSASVHLYRKDVTVSVGAARNDAQDVTFRELYGRADQELYKVKNAGRAQLSVNWD